MHRFRKTPQGTSLCCNRITDAPIILQSWLIVFRIIHKGWHQHTLIYILFSWTLTRCVGWLAALTIKIKNMSWRRDTNTALKSLHFHQVVSTLGVSMHNYANVFLYTAVTMTPFGKYWHEFGEPIFHDTCTRVYTHTRTHTHRLPVTNARLKWTQLLFVVVAMVTAGSVANRGLITINYYWQLLDLKAASRATIDQRVIHQVVWGFPTVVDKV